MNRLVLTNVNVLDGNHPAVANSTLIVEDERIVSVGTTPQATREGDRIVDLAGRTVMPGMATCHYHSTYASGMKKSRSFTPFGYEFPPGYQAIIAYRNLQSALQQGYTIVVGAGSSNEIDPAMKQAIEDGYVTGPRFTPSGRELSTTGHANDIGTPWYWHLPSLGAARNCDGPEAFRFAVRDEVKMGAEVIKLFITRGHLVRGANTQMEMTREELAAAIETAHARNVLIRGHITGKSAIMMALELGIDIVDHCDEMDEEVIAALLETDTSVVPSVLYPKIMSEFLAESDPETAARMRDDVESMRDILPKADASGVRLLLGDDYGGPQLWHGDYGRELRAYVDDLGISPLAVIRWATVYGAELIGRGADLGTVEAGKIADLVVVDGDPSNDIGLLADAIPTAVLKDGAVVSGALPD
jgi:imidazolonepropionase-like amidohydrolase